MKADTISLTPLKANLAVVNTDTTRRLRELGHHPRIGAGIRTTPRDQLEHFRLLVEDPRSDGVLGRIECGQTVIMERTVHPRTKKTWYVILDTALGIAEDTIDELIKRKRVSIQDIALAAIEDRR